jgi:phosphate starvation-inducible PhoH-like protein
MTKETLTRTLQLPNVTNQQLVDLCGEQHRNIKDIEAQLQVQIFHRGDTFQIKSNDFNRLEDAYQLLQKLADMAIQDGHAVDQSHIEVLLSSKDNIHHTLNNKLSIKILNDDQAQFVNMIDAHAITFGLGPSGTGKTFLSVACAVHALQKHHCDKIILVRPAIEAGEKIGYLPGDMTEKINPYLQPLYDSLYELMGYEHTQKLIQQQVIEINLLAFMRGRTFKNSFIIIDEAQNCTHAQLKMALTRLGYKSKMVIVGDASQSDLPERESGLNTATKILKPIKEIGFHTFSQSSVVRHPLIAKIIRAYEKPDHS